jgi:predicted ribosomally synthesized peptide with SipW-like signal peptide
MRTGRLRYPVVALVAWVTGLAGTLTVQGTRAAFSDTTSNPGNTFQAASSFYVGGGT